MQNTVSVKIRKYACSKRSEIVLVLREYIVHGRRTVWLKKTTRNATRYRLCQNLAYEASQNHEIMQTIKTTKNENHKPYKARYSETCLSGHLNKAVGHLHIAVSLGSPEIVCCKPKFSTVSHSFTQDTRFSTSAMRGAFFAHIAIRHRVRGAVRTCARGLRTCACAFRKCRTTKMKLSSYFTILEVLSCLLHGTYLNIKVVQCRKNLHMTALERLSVMQPPV